MLPAAHPTPTSAADAALAPARRPLELVEARQARDSLRSLLRTEQAAMADFLVALAAFDERRGWEALGHASLFAFLVADLGLSAASTYWRQSAARLLRDFPELERHLRQGRLCLTTMAELAKVLTRENMEALLPRFLGLSSREAKVIVAELRPREAPPLRSLVTGPAPAATGAEPPPAAESSAFATIPGAAALAAIPARPATERAPPVAPPDTDRESFRAPEMDSTKPARAVTPRDHAVLGSGATPRDDVEPLTADLRRLHFTVSRQFLDELAAARDGLSHALPGATTEQVLREGLRLLLEKQARARGQVKWPRTVLPIPAPTGTPAESLALTPPEIPHEPPRHRRGGPRAAIPAAVRRAVWARDGGRCSWPLDGGGCCGSTRRLQLDHLVPWADGGGETEGNLRLVCAAHNRLAARQRFGDGVMGRYDGVREPVAEYAAALRPAAAWGFEDLRKGAASRPRRLRARPTTLPSIPPRESVPSDSTRREMAGHPVALTPVFGFGVARSSWLVRSASKHLEGRS